MYQNAYITYKRCAVIRNGRATGRVAKLHKTHGIQLLRFYRANHTAALDLSSDIQLSVTWPNLAQGL